MTASLLALVALLATGCQLVDSAAGEAGPAPEGESFRPFVGVIEGEVKLPPHLTFLDLNEPIIMEIRQIPLTLGVETVAEGLEIPWDLAFAPDGRILITERPGRIRVFKDGVLLPEPYATLDVAHVSEAGLMGIALDPDFLENGYLYVCYTYRNGGEMFNRIARLTDAHNQGTDHQPILDGIPGASRHDGCRIRFGPDGYLYATTGDATEPDLAQDLASLAGKVLRLVADGSVPLDNPFPNSYVYTWGHRNPQGLDWHPETGDLFITEHGPSRDDEVNLLEPGKNYGWPEVTGSPGHAEYVDSVLSLTPTVAIAGAAFVAGDKLPGSWQGNLVYAALKGSHLQRVVLEPPEYRSVASSQTLLQLPRVELEPPEYQVVDPRLTLFPGEFGRLRAVVMGPDGYLYFTTSNRDGRGSPRTSDDRLLRLVPRASTHVGQMELGPGFNFDLSLPLGTYLLRWESPQIATEERRVILDKKGTLDLGTINLGAIEDIEIDKGVEQQ